MCVVSMVSDHYMEPFRQKEKRIGDFFGPLQQWRNDFQAASLKSEIEELRKLIADFREAMAAAKRVDELTAQPDCVDPKKATLVDRVADLERRLDSIGI